MSKTFKTTKAKNSTISDSKRPGGCSAVSSSDGSGIEALFNSAQSAVECGYGANIFTGMANDTTVGVSLSLELDIARDTIQLSKPYISQFKAIALASRLVQQKKVQFC